MGEVDVEVGMLRARRRYCGEESLSSALARALAVSAGAGGRRAVVSAWRLSGVVDSLPQLGLAQSAATNARQTPPGMRLHKSRPGPFTSYPERKSINTWWGVRASVRVLESL